MAEANSTSPSLTVRTKRAAVGLGYQPLTTGYRLPREQWMLDGVVADLQHRQRLFVLVKQPSGIEVWTKASGRKSTPAAVPGMVLGAMLSEDILGGGAF